MSKNFYIKLITSGGIFMVALMVTNFLNFLFNAILGRVLTLEQFSVLTLVSTLWALITIVLSSLSATTTNRTAYIHAKRGDEIAWGFRNFFTRKTTIFSIIFFVFWLLITPILSNVFYINNLLLLSSIAPAIIFGIFAAVTRGFFQGMFSFTIAAIIILTESISKLIFALIFIYLGISNLAYLSIPLSIALSFVVAAIFVLKIPKITVDYKYIFPKKLFFATFLTAVGGSALLTIDVLLARHYLSAADSGAYSLLSLVGKMVYFMGTLFSVFILTYASRDTGLNKNSATNFYKILAGNIALLITAFVFLGIFGNAIIPILFGQKSLGILPYLTTYCLAMIYFSVAGCFATYHLAKQQYIFAYTGIFTAVTTVLGLFVFHANISNFTNVILFSSFVYLALNVMLHIFYKDVSEYVDDEDTRKFADFDNIHMKPLPVAICVPAFNEEKNIGELLSRLLTQETRLIKIQKIVVVSSASTDSTDEVVRSFIKKNPKRILLIRQLGRHGKSAAINSFLKRANHPVVVVQSADTLPVKDTIEKLCRPFLVDEKIGMTGGAPYPVNNPDTFLGFVIHTWWWFHRHIPRFGEIIAFRNIIQEVSPRTSVDEAYIQAKFAQMGYKIVHIQEAKIYNKGSESIRDIIKQRRRIFNGHTRLAQEENVHISNMSRSGIKLLLLDYKMYSFVHLVWLAGGMMIEIWANILGQYDRRVNKINPVIWDIAKSTKDLVAGSKGGFAKK